jgi:hypothetical protein
MTCTHPIVGEGMARMISGRIHVGTSDRDVLREARRALKPSHRNTGGTIRAERHGFYRAMLAAHAGDRELYAQVVSGRIGR